MQIYLLCLWGWLSICVMYHASLVSNKLFQGKWDIREDFKKTAKRMTLCKKGGGVRKKNQI